MPLALVALVLLHRSAPVAPEPRHRVRFDAGWRFRRGAEAVPGAGRGPFAWEFHPSAAANLEAAPETPADGWRPVRLGDNVLKSGDLFGLFRTDLGDDPGLWPAGRPRVLVFESVDDNAAIYLNGKLLATERGYGREFRVALDPAWIKGGPNRLVLLVENTGGEGGINGGVNPEAPHVERPIPDEARPGFRDRDWRTVHLPHDYVVEGTFSPQEDAGHGSLPRARAWYRKTFGVPAAMRGRAIWLDFDGVYRNAEVYLNGERLGTEPSGYIGFRFDVSKRLRYGATNTLAVHVDPTRDEGWWYEGGGIYRHVWMTDADPVHLAPDSVFVKSAPIDGGEGIFANLVVTYDVVNAGTADEEELTIEHTVLDARGRVVERMDNGGPLGAGETVHGDSEGAIDAPKLWSPESPNLYRLVSRLRRAGRVIDSVTTPFGVRSLAWDKDRGFLLNGKPVKLKGTCNHQDHAGLGVALPDRMFDWRIKRLKEMGSNAYRCSHNPPAPELLDACDRLGMLVLDETRHLGDATSAKSPSGTGSASLSELRRMIVRDRNHPSVFAWSLFNEEGLQGTPEGAAIFLAMRRVADELDGTRESTGANNGGFDAGIVDVTRVFGFNYGIGAYEGVRARHPETPLFGSETASTVSTRGEYANDPARGYVSAYDVNHPSWAETAENAWRPIAERPWMAGAFVWTGFDYRGEPTPYGWPCISSHFGILDTCGFPKDNFFYYQAQWGTKPVVHLLPHWNWAGKEGQPIEVWAHSNAESVELLLNGRSLGVKPVPKYGHAAWSVPYAPGRLEARGRFANGRIVREVVETTGPPAAIRLRTTERDLLADGEDVSPVDVEIVDARGRVVPTADDPVTFAVTGAGEVRGVGNGDPSSHEPDKASARRAFHGLGAVYVGATERPGAILLRASAPGLGTAVLKMRSKAVVRPRG